MRQRIAPDGCMDWLFDFGGGSPHAARVIGTMSRAQDFVPHGLVSLLGVRFEPGAFTALVRVEAAELLDIDAALTCFLGFDAEALWERLALMAPSSRRKLLAGEIQRRLLGRPDAYVAHCVSRIESSAGLLRIGDLERSTGLGSRQLERKFATHVGVSPKVFARIVRLKHVLARIDGDSAADWTTVAHATGYADQAHLSREFKALMGCSPSEYSRAPG